MIFCKRYLSSNEFGLVFEKYIKNILNIEKSRDKVSGDGILNDKNVEIKVSLGDKKGQLNFVQIRPDHNVQYYIFICYNLFEDKIGKDYIFLFPSNRLYDLIPKYG